MLSYAVERLPEAHRRRYLRAARVAPADPVVPAAK
jgi:hypothetical protein